MIALVSGATTTLKRHVASGLFGQLHVPGDGNKAIEGLPWACDNGAFTAFDEPAFWRMLARYSERKGCLWVAAPDVVGEACPTLTLFYHYEPLIRSAGYPVALVAQDGLTPEVTPWHRLDALFVGGSTGFKLGSSARLLMREAKKRDKLVHVGRVNTAPRMRYLQGLNGLVDSVDGTKLSMWPEVWFPQFVNLLGNPQLGMEVDVHD